MKVCLALLRLLIFVGLLASCKKSTSQQPATADTTKKDTLYVWTKFVMGADLSFVNQIEDCGGVYKEAGMVQDPYKIFNNHGANLIRVRLWHNPAWTASLNKGKLYSDLADVEKTIRRAKNVGMAIDLDFHYSDTWADPDHQTLPAAWKNLPLATLQDSVYNYTFYVLNYLKTKGLTPELVQIGNETNQGMLWPIGKITNNDFTPFCKLLNSGIKAVRDFSVTSPIKPLIMLHVAQMQHADYYADWVINKGGVTDFDVLGISHYVDYTTLTSMTAVSDNINMLIKKYHKQVMLAETSYPWTTQNADAYPNIANKGFAGYPITPSGQFAYMKDLTQAVIKGGGTGIMYWEPAWITSSLKDLWGTGSSWDNNTFFDFSGNTLPAIDFMSVRYVF